MNISLCNFDSVDDSLQCDFVKQNIIECQQQGGLIDYLTFVLCFGGGQIGAILILTLWLIVLFFTLAITSEHFFYYSLTAMCHILRLSDEVAGVTLLALGNGAPDFFTQISALIGNASVNLGIATLYGTDMVCTTVIVGSVAISAKEPFSLDRAPFLRDIIFLAMVEGWLVLILWREKTSTAEMAVFSSFYIVYILIVIFAKRIITLFKSNTRDPTEEIGILKQSLSSDSYDVSNSLERKKDGDFREAREMSSLVGRPSLKNYQPLDEASGNQANDIEDLSDGLVPIKESNHSQNESVWWKLLIQGLKFSTDNEWEDMVLRNKISYIIKQPFYAIISLTVPIVNYEMPLNSWNRPLNSLNIVLGPLFVLFITGTAFTSVYRNFNLAELILVVVIVLASAVFLTSSNQNPPVYQPVFAFLAFVITIMWLYFSVTEIVNILEVFGQILDISDEILGLTVLAWGNTLPELIADINLSKKGRPKMAVSACFGTPIFDALVSFGATLLIGCILNGGTYSVPRTKINFVTANALLITVVFSFFWITISRFRVKKLYGFCLLTVYVILLTLVILFEFGDI